jgi:deoxyribonuclease IV
MRRFGFHLSIAGSIANAPKEALKMSYGAFQIFTTSSRSWKNSQISPEDAADFKKCTSGNGPKPFAHIPYLCNPASTNKIVYEKSRQMLVDNLKNCGSLGIDYLVIHLGSHLGSGVDIGIDNICSMLNFSLDASEKVNILLENGSGYKNCVGSKFSEIGKIIDNIGSNRIGVCFDTCHAFAAGYDMRTLQAVERTMEDFTSHISPSKLMAVHLNDAKYDFGSGLDRHFHIGKGYIGTGGFESLFKNKIFESGSFIMELPEDSLGSHSDDMNAVLSITKSA